MLVRLPLPWNLIPPVAQPVAVIIGINPELLASVVTAEIPPVDAIYAIVVTLLESHRSIRVKVLAVPIGMNDKTEVRLRELPVARLKKVAGVGGNPVAGDWHIFEHSLADDRSVHVGCRDGNLQ